jgi:hypothetical protein
MIGQGTTLGLWLEPRDVARQGGLGLFYWFWCGGHGVSFPFLMGRVPRWLVVQC